MVEDSRSWGPIHPSMAPPLPGLMMQTVGLTDIVHAGGGGRSSSSQVGTSRTPPRRDPINSIQAITLPQTPTSPTRTTDHTDLLPRMQLPYRGIKFRHATYRVPGQMTKWQYRQYQPISRRARQQRRSCGGSGSERGVAKPPNISPPSDGRCTVATHPNSFPLSLSLSLSLVLGHEEIALVSPEWPVGCGRGWAWAWLGMGLGSGMVPFHLLAMPWLVPTNDYGHVIL
jgi:hypothetical protein